MVYKGIHIPIMSQLTYHKSCCETSEARAHTNTLHAD